MYTLFGFLFQQTYIKDISDTPKPKIEPGIKSYYGITANFVWRETCILGLKMTAIIYR